MTLIVLLFAIGIVFLLIEVIIPGGILGSIGALTIFAGCAVAFIQLGTIGGMIAVSVALVVAIVAFYVEFRVLPRTKLGRRAFLNSEIDSVSAAYGSEARDLIGKSAVAITMLSPSGYITIDGKRYEAFCQAGQVPAGTSLKVTGNDSFRLIVSPETQTPSPA
jgi:membrane-bound ClpP family serine protease